MEENDIESMLKCLNAIVRTYSKNRILLLMGDDISSVGIILSGSVLVVKEDEMGNKNILTEVRTGELFGETVVCAGITKSPVTVETLTGCEVMFIDYKRILRTCSSSCVFHTKLIENMIKVVAEKNIMLTQKVEYLSKSTTREKLILYLSNQSRQNNSKHFIIPFSRNELSDFLCVDRSAMSREISRLRDEGLINFNKNKFEILY